MRPALKTIAALMLVVSLGTQSSEPPQTAAATEPPPAPKIIPLVWSIAGTVAQHAFPYFLRWLTSSRKSEAEPGHVLGPALNTAILQPNTLVSLARSSSRAVITTMERLTGLIGSRSKSIVGAVPNAVIVGEPDIPVQIAANGQPNYQGVHLAVVSVDTAAGTSRFRALSDGFQTGERFKLRVVSTFDAAIVIEAKNPSGKQTRLYPAAEQEIVFVKAGDVTMLPLDDDQFFEFANQTGNEQLLVTARDPRGVAEGLSNQPIYRQDEAWGTNLLQLTPAGSFAGFTQAVALKHIAGKS